MTGPDPSVPPGSATPPAAPPPATPPARPPAPPTTAATAPAQAASTAPAASMPGAMAEAEHAMASAEHSMMAAEAKAAGALNVSGADSLILAGAALFLIVGELLFGEILGGAGGGASFGLGSGITLAGVLAGEVILFLWLIGPRPGKTGLVSAGASQAVVAALVVAIFLFVLGDFILTLKNLSTFTSLGIVAILEALSRWAGAVLMGLGVVSAWTPAPATTAAKK